MPHERVEREACLRGCAATRSWSTSVCMSVEPDDVVTIITDDDHLDEANALAQVVVERGGYPVIANNEHQVQRAIADMRFPMAPPRNLHQAMTTLRRDHHHHQSGVGQPLRARLRGARVVRQQRQDRLGRGGHRLLGSHRGRHPGRHRPRQGRYGGSRRRHMVPGDLPRRHRRPRLDRGAAGAGSDADQEARPDDGSGAALGGSRLRRGRGPHRRDDRRRRDHARHRLARSDAAPNHLESRKGPRYRDHRR